MEMREYDNEKHTHTHRKDLDFYFSLCQAATSYGQYHKFRLEPEKNYMALEKIKLLAIAKPNAQAHKNAKIQISSTAQPYLRFDECAKRQHQR